MQSNEDCEVHTSTCSKAPTQNFEDLGLHNDCNSAVQQAKRKHPLKRINGCLHCSKACHTL